MDLDESRQGIAEDLSGLLDGIAQVRVEAVRVWEHELKESKKGRCEGEEGVGESKKKI